MSSCQFACPNGEKLPRRGPKTGRWLLHRNERTYNRGSGMNLKWIWAPKCDTREAALSRAV